MHIPSQQPRVWFFIYLMLQLSPRIAALWRDRLLEDGKTWVSLNNRRLFVLRWARREGLLPGNLVGARVKPMETASRHAAK
jgi:hypothetical protein